MWLFFRSQTELDLHTGQEVKKSWWYAKWIIFLCVCLHVWFTRGLCILPNFYCHNAVRLWREQGFHSREKRGRVGFSFPLWLYLNAQQIHIHDLKMQSVRRTFVFNLRIFGLHTLIKMLILGLWNANRGQMLTERKGSSWKKVDTVCVPVPCFCSQRLSSYNRLSIRPNQGTLCSV